MQGRVMLLYHPKSNSPVDCHPTQIENMKANGWMEDPPDKSKPRSEPKTKPKSETKPATQTK